MTSHTRVKNVFKGNRMLLTLQAATTPSPPEQTMLCLMDGPHQSGLVQVSWSTMGIRACCSVSGRGPPAVTQPKA